MDIPRETAEVWASWFRALGDPTRVLMLHFLASQQRPVTIGEIVDALDVGQSTVSHHCRILEQAGFVLCEKQGTSTNCRINERCLAMFPTMADVVMGQAPMREDLGDGCAPWVAPERAKQHTRRLRRRQPATPRRRR